MGLLIIYFSFFNHAGVSSFFWGGGVFSVRAFVVAGA